MHSGGYVLDVDPEDVDLHRFHRLRRQADSVAGSGDDAHAALLLREADTLWHGQTLAGLPGQAMARLRHSIDMERRAALLERVRLELALGRHADLVGELHRLSSEYPLDEAFIAHQMMALYRSGRLADAVAVFMEIHSQLTEDQGIEPGPELSELHQRILRRDPGLAVTPAYVWRGRTPRVSSLPPSIGNFVGRVNQIRLLSELEHTSAPEIKVIEGMPGVGKTTLAVQVAHRMTERYADGQLFLSYHAHDPGHPTLNPADALHRLLVMLHIPAARIPRSLPERSALWRSELSRRRMVVVLDDVPGTEEICPALPATGDCLILITTRPRLSGLNNVHPMVLDVLTADDAITLFTLTAGVERTRDGATVAKAVRLCGRLPLAIQVAASRLRHARSSSLADLVEELSHSRDRPGHADAVSPEVMSAFELSYQGLSREEQCFFRHLGLSPCPDITLHAAVALTGRTLADAEAALCALLDRHLLEQITAAHFRFHDLTRAYASARAARDEPEPERRKAVGRLLDYYLHTADHADRILYPHRRRIPTPVSHDPIAAPFMDTADASRKWLESEWRNILQAAGESTRHERKRYCEYLTHVLADFLETSGYWDEAIAAHTLALQACRDLDDPLGVAQATLELSLVSLRTGSYRKALQHAQEAAAIYGILSDQQGRAAALDRIGIIQRYCANLPEALAHHQEAMEIYQEIGDQHGMAETLCHAGICYDILGRYSEAITHFNGALSLYRQAGNRRGEALTLNNIGSVKRAQGYHRDALSVLQESLKIHREIGGRQILFMLRHNMGEIQLYKGDYEEALASYRSALAISHETGDRRNQAGTLSAIGAVYQRMERYDEALIHHQKASVIAEEIADSQARQLAFFGIAEVHRGIGHYDIALDYYSHALTLAREIGYLYEQARVLEGIADTLLRTRRREAARIHWRQALDLFQQLGAPEAEAVRIRLQTLGAAAS